MYVCMYVYAGRSFTQTSEQKEMVNLLCVRVCVLVHTNTVSSH